jgi:hypothetical protein
MDWCKLSELAVSGLVTLTTGFAGAFFAFKFNLRKEAAALRTSRIEECNRAMLGLLREYNILESYRKHILEPERSKPGRHLSMRASANHDPAIADLKPASLAFLLATEARDLPAEISVLDEKFRSCADAINARSRLHFEQYQPKLEEIMTAKGGGTFIDGHTVDAGIGARLTQTLKALTDDIYTSVDGAIKDLLAAGTAMPKQMKAAFPGAKIISFKGPADEAPSA